MTTAIDHDDWTLYNAEGYMERAGVTVRRHDTCVQIAGTLHDEEDLAVAEDRIESRLAGWCLTR